MPKIKPLKLFMILTYGIFMQERCWMVLMKPMKVQPTIFSRKVLDVYRIKRGVPSTTRFIVTSPILPLADTGVCRKVLHNIPWFRQGLFLHLFSSLANESSCHFLHIPQPIPGLVDNVMCSPL